MTSNRLKSPGLKSIYASGLVGLLMVTMASCSSYATNTEEQDLVWNRAGYTQNSPKWAYLRNDTADTFHLISVENSDTLFTGQISNQVEYDSLSGDYISKLDFSEFDQAGSYKLNVPEHDIVSAPFFIGSQAYHEELIPALRSFYLQRCGTAIEDSDWQRRICHINDGPFFNNRSETRNTTGGWHDAGDYNKFAVTTAVSAGLLMQLYELNPEFIGSISLDIPESYNDRPDLLDEVKWALDWLMRMQRDDGAVYFKVSEKQWTGEFLPHHHQEVRYIFDVSSAATAGASAVFAQGARLFQEFDERYANRLLQASEKAWDWLAEHPEIYPEGGFRNPDGVQGGEYHDSNDRDERMWAASELMKTTGIPVYQQYIENNYSDLFTAHILLPLSWMNTGSLALASLMGAEAEWKSNHVKAEITERIIENGDRLVARVDSNPYRYILTEGEFYWGSNSVALGYAVDLITAWRATGDLSYIHAAEHQLHYILGRNPFGMAYVTSHRPGWVNRPYHQWVITSHMNKPIEGMLVGGPNNNSGMRISPSHNYPAKWYRDDSREYTVNETAINYTASYAYVLGFFSLPKTDHLITETQ